MLDTIPERRSSSRRIPLTSNNFLEVEEDNSSILDNSGIPFFEFKKYFYVRMASAVLYGLMSLMILHYLSVENEVLCFSISSE